LPRGAGFGGVKKIHVQAGLPCAIEQDRNQENLPVIQRDTEGAAIGADDHIVDGTLPKLTNSFRDASKILNRGQRHEPRMLPSRHVLRNDFAQRVVGDPFGLGEQ
jgi:hypothetical protein